MASFLRLTGLSGAFFVFASLFSALFLSASLPLRAQMADGIIAIVNDSVIPFSEVQKQVDDTERSLRETYDGPVLVEKIKEARLNTLRALIERELIIQDAKEQGLFIPDSFIEARIKAMIQNQYEGDRTAFIRTIQSNGMSLSEVKKNFRDNAAIGYMRRHNIPDNIVVSPYRVEQYYQDNVAQFTQEEQAKVSIIFLRKATDPARADQVKGLADEILLKLDSGADFAEIARSYSEGPRRADGGDLGWVRRGDLRAELVKVAFGLQPGQTSRVVPSDDGFYIVRVEDTKRPRVSSMTEVRASIERTLLQEERQRLQQKWIDGLRGKAFIKTNF
ncbi:peptidyl-prolyl cis-trans isomerase SurA/foldase protein PrsA [Verrucomicrobium sp. GAS474]|uniref:peptidylprolyl isomerase n=1 Tax=Verrucomicrobium sp. GAS474 TaxID=1882831 RepID=UPI00087AEEDC|nr:peptidylprolyl isomerase [Verrucomicrobium sp. GAS474]SDT99819.1 peptidyl-prolyl cis-trans isomerase SurA/foldase protein PrsA [Verrucomicrobium sp. GAS474]